MRLAVLLLSWCLVAHAHAASPQQDDRKPPPPREQDNNRPNQDGIEVEARGQVHEAFAAPHEARQAPTPIVAKKPPEPINELPPEQKPEGDNVQWIPGYWMWDEDRTDFLWVSGTWRVMPPERRWIPGYWNQAEGGYQWVSGYWYAEAETHVTLLPEPPAPVEEAMPAVTDTQTYIPGNWVYRDSRYWWQPGVAVNQQAGWLWTPASYRWTPGGYVYADGYWDYDFQHRGLAFAPVSINVGLYSRPNWSYRPSYVINTNSFYGSLFINTGWNHYFFGDYYDAGYARRGYTPWYSYRYANRYQDPIYSYYRWNNRGNQRWEREIQNTYVGRRDGRMDRPGRTFTPGDRARTGNDRQGANDNTLVSLNQWKGDNFKLQRLAQGEDKKIVDHYRHISSERFKNERGTRPSPYPRENNARKDGNAERKDATPPPTRGNDGNPGRKDNVPPTKEAGKIPPGKQEAVPPAKNTLPGKDLPPGKTTVPPVGNTANRYELPKTNQNYRPSTGTAIPQRPTRPQPVQNPGRQQAPPAKQSAPPAKQGNPPGK